MASPPRRPLMPAAAECIYGVALTTCCSARRKLIGSALDRVGQRLLCEMVFRAQTLCQRCRAHPSARTCLIDRYRLEPGWTLCRRCLLMSAESNIEGQADDVLACTQVRWAATHDVFLVDTHSTMTTVDKAHSKRVLADLLSSTNQPCVRSLALWLPSFASAAHVQRHVPMLVAMSRTLRVLILGNANFTVESFTRTFQTLPGLTQLELKQVTFKDPSQLSLLIDYVPMLEHVTVERCLSWSPCVAALAKAQRLAHVSLDLVSSGTESYLPFATAKRDTPLRSLKVTCPARNATPFDFISWCDPSTAGLTALTDLDVSSQFCALASGYALSQCVRLVNVTLAVPWPDGSVLRQIVRALAAGASKTLRTLVLPKCNPLAEDDLAVIGAELCSLTELDLAECRGFKVVTGLARSRRLEKLVLRKTAVESITDLDDIPTLRTLDIAQCSQLIRVDALAHAPSLETLLADETPVAWDHSRVGRLTTLQVLRIRGPPHQNYAFGYGPPPAPPNIPGGLPSFVLGSRLTEIDAVKCRSLKPLEYATQLVHFAISDSPNIRDASGVFQYNLMLRSVSLQRTGVTDIGLEHLEGLKFLEKLSLTDSKAVTAVNVVRAIRGLERLEACILQGTTRTDEDMIELREVGQKWQLEKRVFVV